MRISKSLFCCFLRTDNFFCIQKHQKLLMASCSGRAISLSSAWWAVWMLWDRYHCLKQNFYCIFSPFFFFFCCPVLFCVNKLVLLGAGYSLWNILHRKKMACRYGERGVMAAGFWEHVGRFRADKMLLWAWGIWAEALELSMATSLKLLAKMRSLQSWWFVRMHSTSMRDVCDLVPVWLANEVIPWLPVPCAYYGQCDSGLWTAEAWKSQLWPYTRCQGRHFKHQQYV